MELSKRLYAVASLVPKVSTMADVGTDHGYIPIYLVQNHKCQYAIAMDINRGPLEKAKKHIYKYGLDKYIEARLSDGVSELNHLEAQCVVLAGMGGTLMIHIVEEGKDIFSTLDTFVLQPQSELKKVRAYLVEHGYKILREDMVKEDGKYYPMMQVAYGKGVYYNEAELRYGPILLQNQHPLLLSFLVREQERTKKIIDVLAIRKKQEDEKLLMLKKEYEIILEALTYFQ